MAKNITRTITTTDITYLAMDSSECVVTLTCSVDECDPNAKHPAKVAAAHAASLGCIFITVKSVTTHDTLYTMPVADFIKYATPATADTN